jgi:membrane-associated phospholipid phosphatase
VAQVGFELIRAQAISQGLVQGLKYTIRRERPDESGATSLPSGHAALTFATATVLQRRFGWLGALPAYAFASYVGASRVATDRHYVSDVVAGAFIGTLVGRRVTRDANTMTGLVPVIQPGSVAIVWVSQPRF